MIHTRHWSLLLSTLWRVAQHNEDKDTLQAFAGDDLEFVTWHAIPLAYVKLFDNASLQKRGLFCFWKHGRGELDSTPSHPLPTPSKIMDAFYELTSSMTPESSPEGLITPTSHRRHLLPFYDVDPSLLSSTLDGWEELWTKLAHDSSSSRPTLVSSLSLGAAVLDPSLAWSAMIGFHNAPALSMDPIHPSFPSLS